jgi:hypothetical protein
VALYNNPITIKSYMKSLTSVNYFDNAEWN